MTQAVASYPRFDGAVGELVKEHLELKDEPLRLALYYAPERDESDVFLFEVIEGFGANDIDPDREFFEVTYASPDGFPLEPGQKLHMLFTTPPEFEAALRENWPHMAELRAAVDAGRSRRIYVSPGFEKLAEKIHA